MREKIFLLFVSLITLVSLVSAHDRESFLIPPDNVLFSNPFVSVGFLIIVATLMFLLIKYVVRLKLPEIPLATSTFKAIVAIALFIGTSSWYWDGWWHITLGIDRLFSPPHLLVYFSHTALIFSVLYLFQRTKNNAYYYLLIASAVTYFFGFVDMFWHGYFGLEKEVTPLMVWSPSHLVSFGSMLVGMFILLFAWLKEYDKEQSPESFFRLVLVSGAGFTILGIITLSPLHPLGWHHIFGVWGAIFTTFLTVVYLLYIAYRLPKSGIVTMSALIIYAFISFEAFTSAPGVYLIPHSTPPFWLHFMAIIAGAIWIDFTNIRNKNLAFIGGLAGFLTTFTYALFWRFVQNDTFSYTSNESYIFVLMGLLGGVFAGIVADIIIYKKYKRLFSNIMSMNKKFLLLALVVIIFIVGFGYGFMFNHYNDQQNKLSIPYFQELAKGNEQGHEHVSSVLHSYSSMTHEIFNVDEGGAPDIDLEIHPDPKSGWNIEFITNNFKFTPLSASGEHRDGEGHAHLFIDNVKINRLYSNWYHLPELTTGQHEIKVTLNTNDHKDYSINNVIISDSETIIVEEN